ncbi:hypothetical protein [Paenibacillus luteus]|uniref:hypothetical protein n=1 Tax=Paenibacillus luteus TaxID=2545753 RepID=UPI001141A05D|nr:hypothetical protein [Paenibacillus luteus]
MIRQGPELYEWEYLLECEAKRADHEIDWYYTGASFELERNGIRLELTVQPAIGSSWIIQERRTHRVRLSCITIIRPQARH